MRTILLDTGPLGQVVHGNKKTRAPIEAWILDMASAGATIKIPAIADYELRRELLLNRFAPSITLLDQLIQTLGYVAISKGTSHRACDLWAQARQTGMQTAGNDDLDGDMILCAHALHDCEGNCIIATTNSRHIDRFVLAKQWDLITVADLA